tara:strand:- start:904 stop:1773 length:870 start_codon:yes stop_codon:yes gene_type:complete
MTNIQQHLKLRAQYEEFEKKEKLHYSLKNQISLDYETSIKNIFIPIIKSKLKKEFYIECNNNEFKVLINSEDNKEKIFLFKIVFNYSGLQKIFYNTLTKESLSLPPTPIQNLSIYHYLNNSLSTPFEVNSFINIGEILKVINKQQYKILTKINDLQIKFRKKLHSKFINPMIKLNIKKFKNQKLFSNNLRNIFFNQLQKLPYTLDNGIFYDFQTMLKDSYASKGDNIFFNKLKISSISLENVTYKLTDEQTTLTPTTTELTLNSSNFSLIDTLIMKSNLDNLNQYLDIK